MKFICAFERRYLLWCGAVCLTVAIGLSAYLFIGWPQTYPHKIYGVTWSVAYARYLGIDPIEGLTATLDDLKLRNFRIPLYWSEVEPRPGEFDWSMMDQELDMIAARGGKAVLVIGAKQPRWPECWFPSWAKALSADGRFHAQLDYMSTAVKRYANHPALAVWQIENEPNFFSSFGDCRLYDSYRLQTEVNAVRSAYDQARDQRHLSVPLITTAAGELSTWSTGVSGLDGLGVSVYRLVVTPWSDRWEYRLIPPWFYARKAKLLTWLTGPVFVSEFQMEPWSRTALIDTSIERQLALFDHDQMQKNFAYSQGIDVSSVYFWGAEWWYWMKTKQHHPEFWQTAKDFFSSGE